jgi:hypothetical protein
LPDLLRKMQGCRKTHLQVFKTAAFDHSATSPSRTTGRGAQ